MNNKYLLPIDASAFEFLESVAESERRTPSALAKLILVDLHEGKLQIDLPREKTADRRVVGMSSLSPGVIDTLKTLKKTTGLPIKTIFQLALQKYAAQKQAITSNSEK